MKTGSRRHDWSAAIGLGEPTFAEARADGRKAPIPAIRSTAME
jgi:hypothetical protein